MEQQRSPIAANKLKNAMRALVRKASLMLCHIARILYLERSRCFAYTCSEQNIETGGSFSSWYSTDDSYEQA